MQGLPYMCICATAPHAWQGLMSWETASWCSCNIWRQNFHCTFISQAAHLDTLTCQLCTVGLQHEKQHGGIGAGFCVQEWLSRGGQHSGPGHCQHGCHVTRQRDRCQQCHAAPGAGHHWWAVHICVSPTLLDLHAAFAASPPARGTPGCLEHCTTALYGYWPWAWQKPKRCCSWRPTQASWALARTLARPQASATPTPTRSSS